MTDKLEYELVECNCQEGPCLMLREDTTDTKIGALSFDHKSIGEAIVDELNKLAKELYKLTQQAKDIEQLKSILKDAENEIERLKESNKGLLESIVEHESED